MKVDDTLLVAFADGELDAKEAAQVERMIAEDPLLRARLEALTQAADLTRALFEAKSRESVPAAMIANIMAAGEPESPNKTVRQSSRREPLLEWRKVPLSAFAFGAVMLLAVGGLVGYLLPQTSDIESPIVTAGVVPPESTLFRLLQQAPSGMPWQDRALELEIVSTFISDARVCREYRATSEQGRQEYHAGVACLRGGDWHIAFAVDDYLEREPVGGLYETASNKLHEAIDTFIEQYLSVNALDDAAEHDLLDRNWQVDE